MFDNPSHEMLDDVMNIYDLDIDHLDDDFDMDEISLDDLTEDFGSYDSN